MVTLALLWVLLVAAEGVAYTNLTVRRSYWRHVLLALLLVGILASTGLRLWAGWQAWALFCTLSLYRVVNLLRFWVARLPEPRLRPVSIRAHAWLVTLQAIVLGVGWLVTSHHWGMDAFDILVVAQLLGAIVLLRASLYTWQYATAPSATPALTDKEAPSVSVLVPARNETDELERCLQALIASDYPKLEIVVLDDCSVNRRTPEIIRSYAHDGVRFVQGTPPDETRWLAKNFAYEQLSREASGEILLFCGVDARLEPHTLRRLVSILKAQGKDMLSVMPLRVADPEQGNSILQAMRYYWEICLPRRVFKRPPVLSTCWLIRRETLARMGGFESVSRSVNPEAPLARKAVVNDAYSFVRSDDTLGLYSDKSADEQYDTSVRVRYPQLHRRLELVAVTSLFELIFLLGPIIGLFFAGTLAHAMAYVAMWSVALVCLVITYSLVAVGARLSDGWYGWALMPVAFVLDLALLHISMWKYEFSSVDWKGRNVCIPVMQIIPRLPKQD